MATDPANWAAAGLAVSGVERSAEVVGKSLADIGGSKNVGFTVAARLRHPALADSGRQQATDDTET